MMPRPRLTAECHPTDLPSTGTPAADLAPVLITAEAHCASHVTHHQLLQAGLTASAPAQRSTLTSGAVV